MTVELEDRVRSTLRDRAGTIEVGRPRPEDVFDRVRHRRRRRRAVQAAAAVVVVGLFGAAALAQRGTTSVQTGHAAAPPVALGQPAFIALDGWRLDAVFVLGPYTEYQFADATRRLQVGFYEESSRIGGATNPTEVRLRGTTGVTSDEGAPRYRVDWNEQGYMWEADGEPFASIDDFLATLEGLRVIDEATWKAALPAGVGDQILANTGTNVSWYEDKGISCFDSQNSVPCR